MKAPNKTLEPTRDGALSSASRAASFGPACVSSIVRKHPLIMLANFYFEASRPAVVIGALVALGLVIALGFTRRLGLSALWSAFGCGVIAFCVVLCGEGDVILLAYLIVSPPLAAIVGGLAGLISASVMRNWKRPAEHRPEGLQDKSPDAS